MDEDRQLALYAIAIKDIFGQDKEVKLIWHYLAHNTKIISTRTNHQLENLKEEIINLIKKIETTTEFPPQKSILCGWCEYQTMCPQFGGSPPNEGSRLVRGSSAPRGMPNIQKGYPKFGGCPPQKQLSEFEQNKVINSNENKISMVNGPTPEFKENKIINSEEDKAKKDLENYPTVNKYIK
jgi:hypothetical protein